MAFRPLHIIAAEIERDWRAPIGSGYYSRVSAGARPYLNAMKELDSVCDKYGLENGRDIVNRFLCNATYWRGPVARRIKTELKEWLK